MASRVVTLFFPVLILSLFLSKLTFGANACSNTDTNPGIFTCYAGAVSWECYCDGGAKNPYKMYDGSTCQTVDQVCRCGDSDPGGPCAACPYQSKEQAGFCWSNTACNSACGGAPEFPEEMSASLRPLAFLLFSIFFMKRNRKKG